MSREAPEDSRLLRFQKLPRAVRVVYSRPRLFISIIVGVIAALLLPAWLRPGTQALIAWDVSIVVYLTLAFAMMARCGVDYIRRNAVWQDDGRFLILLVTATGAFASIAAIVFELGGGHRGKAELVLAIVTIALSWAAVHTTFALHYAHEYYRGSQVGGLAFPGSGDDSEPDYWDFVYFSFVIGMTAQVSDVGITDKTIRRTATAHGVASFVFNTALVALMVNIAASAL
ncbi:DUF1345 domain-containing protein [Rhodopseudomonas sp. HC1]|uniref:DUF1345 domain-containing protein n=1 Tax=Rhodopseudomonas infernalis TaxID=2897386 RepID=UPI001EE8A448|nr:DUF1345 domain-containing protein [Rhodopseudomonas infernalis]MCG6205757.1 DUF1345 domain-containing protein [Rhodopseudomonas infernalis]